MLTDEQMKEIHRRVRRGQGLSGASMNAEYTQAERDMLRMMDRYKRLCTHYPSLSEIVALFKAMGWQEPQVSNLDTCAVDSPPGGQ